MVSSRTGTSKWLRIARKAKAQALEAGLYTCPLCGVALDWVRSCQPNSPEVDHVIPYAEGGTDSLENVRVICRLCNQRLGGKLGASRGVRSRATDRAVPVVFPTAVPW